MGNMSYCRFENTLRDLQDCYDHMDEELSPNEEKCKEKLIEICQLIVNDYGEEE